ncbi:uncharacterized protein [Ambystoma mexicanum]|uniref:uncharacterized protein n=1 Tax=Ambystoma mexicanum TaxID=8296 RepID=UPI0037E73DF8
MPKMRRNGVSISTPLIESCFNDQIPKEKINNMLEQSNCRMEFEGLTCTTTPAGKTLHGMDWQMEVTGSPKISMQYGGKTIVKVPIAVKAQDPDSKETVYSSSTKIRLTATMSHEDGFLTFTCVSYSIDPTMPDSSCSCQVDNAELKMAMEKCAGEVAEEIMANPVQIALPESLASSDEQEVKVMDGCVVVQSKEDPWKSTDGEATCGPPEMSQPPAESKEHGSPILNVLTGLV